MVSSGYRGYRLATLTATTKNSIINTLSHLVAEVAVKTSKTV